MKIVIRTRQNTSNNSDIAFAEATGSYRTRTFVSRREAVLGVALLVVSTLMLYFALGGSKSNAAAALPQQAAEPVSAQVR